jgi:hypothetical protein
MAAKKKSRKKKSPAKKIRTKTQARKTTSKKSVKKKVSPGKPAAKPNVSAKGGGASKKQIRAKKQARAKRQMHDPALSDSRRVKALSGDADSQGLSDVERADSESVGELLEEGNTFEAGVVRGVEQAEDADEREVRTREFPEDDVPAEYIDKD